MNDCLTLPESRVGRAGYSSEPQAADSLFVPVKQTGAQPEWDPYGFHQGGSTKPGDNLPRPLPPGPRLPDTQQPQPDMPRQPRPELPLPPLPERPQEYRLPDGALNVKDSLGRITVTQSADGRKTRAVVYGDPADPYKVTQAVIDNNRVFTRNPDGRSWTVTVNGRPGGTWYGDIRMSAQGEYSFEDYRNGEKRHFAANTAEVVDRNTVHVRRPECNTNNCNTYYDPRARYNYPTQNEWSRYYDPRQGGSCYPQQPEYYPQQQRDYYYPQQREYYPQQRDYYYPQNRRGGCYTDDCSSGYYNRGNIGAQIGRSVLAGVIGYGMPYGGYGYYPRYGGYYGGGGNIAGAVIGSVINRAIWGGGGRGRGCRW